MNVLIALSVGSTVGALVYSVCMRFVPPSVPADPLERYRIEPRQRFDEEPGEGAKP